MDSVIRPQNPTHPAHPTPNPIHMAQGRRLQPPRCRRRRMDGICVFVKRVGGFQIESYDFSPNPTHNPIPGQAPLYTYYPTRICPLLCMVQTNCAGMGFGCGCVVGFVVKCVGFHVEPYDLYLLRLRFRYKTQTYFYTQIPSENGKAPVDQRPLIHPAVLFPL